MKPGRTFWRIVVALAVVATIVVIQLFYTREKLVTDVFALFTDLTADNADRAAMREVVSREGRVIALRLDGSDAESDAQEAAHYLVRSGAATIACVAGTDSLAPFGKALFENRMALLFPRRLAEEQIAYAASGSKVPFEEWLADRAVSNLDTFLATPQSSAFAQIVPQDPLLLIPPCLDAVPAQPAGTGAVVLAEASGASTDEDMQAAALAAVEHLRESLAPHKTTLHATGAVFFAHESRDKIQADVERLNIAMTVMLLAFMLYYLRSFRTMIAVALPVLLAWFMAIVTLFVFQSHVYALALGIGGILGGISVDCPVHIMLHRRPDETSHVPCFMRLIRPIALGALASVSVFAFLMFSSLPLIRQTGLLVGCGLAISYFTILPCFAAFPPPSDPQTVAKRLEGFRIDGWKHGVTATTLALAALALGSFGLYWNDSLEDLQPPMRELYRENEIVLGGADKGSGEYVVTLGANLSEAIGNARAARADGMAALLSTRMEYDAANEWIKVHGEAFQHELNARLAAAGYDEDAFKSCFDSTTEIDSYDAGLAKIASAAPAGLSWMIGSTNGKAWVVSRLSKGDAAKIAPICRTYRLDVRGQLKEAFGSYRIDTTKLALLGFAVASLVIIAFSGVKRGLAIIAIPALSIAATLGVFGLFGTGLSLFNIVGILLGYGLSMDYALFANHPESARASIRFSAYTTMTAFAALIISIIPAVRALGLSVLLVLFFTLLQCEVRPLAKSDEPD
jgi:predicted exporter